MKERLDVLLTTKGLAKSRTSAALLIKKGVVLVDGQKIIKPSTLISQSAQIEVTEQPTYVSRAGEKLAAALKEFSINVRNKTALDIGASTGGFTDCLLQNGVKKIYAVDVGTNQLDTTLRNNPQIVVMEQTDIRNASIPELVDIITIDVSFISLTHIIPILKKFLSKTGSVIALIKPQFEVGKDFIDKKGIVTDENARQRSVEKIKQAFEHAHFVVSSVITSPIQGSTGNTEFLIFVHQ